jgi:hypothetical protein
MSFTQKITPKGTPYLHYVERIGGDDVQAFVPVQLDPSVSAVWLFHGYGGSDDSILGGYNATALSLVDNGIIAVAPNLGGDKWSSPTAQTFLKGHHTWLKNALTSKGVTLKNGVALGTSMGGSISTLTFAKKIIPNIVGLYLINAVFDTSDTTGSYGSGLYLSFLAAGGRTQDNPYNLATSLFGVDPNVYITYDDGTTGDKVGDPVVIPRNHTKILHSRLVNAGQADNTTALRHDSEHSIPPGTVTNVVAKVKAWVA